METSIEAKKLEEMFNVNAEEITKWDQNACIGILPGKSTGKIEIGPGRPCIFGEYTKQIGFREPISKIDIITRRARNLGMRRSDYLRNLVDEDLIKAGMI